MADKNVIRMYKVLDNKITDKTPLYSPYVIDSDKVNTQTLGKEYTADDKAPGHDRMNVADPDDKALTYEQHLPHQGFSAYGLADPKYSFAPIDELISKDSKDKYTTIDNAPDFVKTAAAAMHKNPDKYDNDDSAWTDTVLDSMQQNGYKMPDTAHIHAYDLFNRFVTGFKKGMPIKSTDDNLRDMLFQMSLGRMDTMERNRQPVFVLASAPEESLISTDDAYNENLSKQRDTMHELLARKITPYKVLDFNRLLDEMNANDEKYKDKDWSVEELMHKYGIEPGTLVSDECMKDIHDDMSNDYKGLLKQRNISNTLIDASRF